MISYAYDALGRLSSRTVQGQGTETFTYDAIGRVNQHNSDLGSFALTYLGQTTQLSSRSLASSTLATTYSYLTNVGDRRLSGVSTTGLGSGQYTTFVYTSNDGDQLTGTAQSSDTTVPYPSNTFSQTASYNNLNQATAVTGQTYTYDSDGNVTSDGVMNYAWDAENRLVTITYVGVSGKTTAFTYDGLGRRVTISSTPAGGGSAITTTYIWCGDEPCQARNSSNMAIKGYYTEGEFAPGSPGTPYFYAQDSIGSVRRVFTGSSAPTYDYDPYGSPLQATAPVTDFNYAGTFYNADSGLYFAVDRIYNPAIGRWLSRDPNGEAADPIGNLYAYVGNDPLNEIDPNGNQTIVGAVIGGIGGAAAGYAAGGLEGALLGGAVGGVVGAFAAPLAVAAATSVVLSTGSITGGAATGAAVLTGINALGGAVATAGVNAYEGIPLTSDLLTGTIIGGVAPLVSGEALLVGSGAAIVGSVSDAAAAALAVNSGLLGTMGSFLDRRLNPLPCK